MINTARDGAAAAVQAVGDKVGTAAGGVAAGVQGLTSTITDLATGAILGGADKPLNTSMTPSDSPKEAVAQAIEEGPLTSEVACKLIDGLAAKYREDPCMMAALAVVFVRARDASAQELRGLLDHLKIAQGSVEYREMRAKEEAR